MRAASIFAVLAVFGVFGAKVGLATVPSPANSSIPSHIHVVGRFGSQPDTSAGRFSVTARDLANNPISGAQIVVDFFSNPDVRLATDQLSPGTVVNCQTRTVRGYTDSRGQAFFTILGTGTSTPAGSTAPTTRIYQDGMLLGIVPTSIYDLDGVNGVGANDFSLWMSDFGSGTNPLRSDYDATGVVGANDLSVWLNTFGMAASAQSATPACP